MAGTEVDGITETGAGWEPDKVMVGEVLKVEPHPNADRLSLPTVALGGGETTTVVCGAPNVAAGQKIAFAREGAMLFSARSKRVEPLKAANIRGVKSAGMVCSAHGTGDRRRPSRDSRAGRRRRARHAARRLPGGYGARPGGYAKPARLPLRFGCGPRGGRIDGRPRRGARSKLPGGGRGMSRSMSRWRLRTRAFAPGTLPASSRA